MVACDLCISPRWCILHTFNRWLKMADLEKKDKRKKQRHRVLWQHWTESERAVLAGVLHMQKRGYAIVLYIYAAAARLILFFMLRLSPGDGSLNADHYCTQRAPHTHTHLWYIMHNLATPWCQWKSARTSGLYLSSQNNRYKWTRARICAHPKHI